MAQSTVQPRGMMTVEMRDEVVQETMRHAVSGMDDLGFLHVVLNGQKLWIPPATIRTMTHCIQLEPDGQFLLHVEWTHLEWLARRLTPGMHFIDVGAATGAFSLPIAKRFGSAVPIVAFEPRTVARDLLARTIGRNGLDWIRVSPLACSDHAGPATFYVLPNDETGEIPYLSEKSSLAPPVVPGSMPTTVDVTTLDTQFADDMSIMRACVKIDVEGLEAKVLAGSLRFLKRVRPTLVIDIHPNPFGPGDTEKDVRSALSPLGYTFGRLAHVLTCDPQP